MSTLSSHVIPNRHGAPLPPPPPVGHGLTHVFESITPALARHWLDHFNDHNRPVRLFLVHRYAADMVAGRWHVNGEPIQFDKFGRLLNGQHRLLAIVESGTTQKILVVRGLEPEAQATMDQGQKRQPHEQLAMAGIAGPADPTVAAALRTYLQWTQNRLFGGNEVTYVTTNEMVEWAKANPDVVALAYRLRTNGLRLGGSPATVLAVALRLTIIDPVDAGVFLAGLADGAGLASDSPVLALRNRLLRSAKTHTRVSNRDTIGLIVIAWNAFRQHRPLTKIQLPVGGLTPETFPVPR